MSCNLDLFCKKNSKFRLPSESAYVKYNKNITVVRGSIDASFCTVDPETYRIKSIDSNRETKVNLGLRSVPCISIP